LSTSKSAPAKHGSYGDIGLGAQRRREEREKVGLQSVVDAMPQWGAAFIVPLCRIPGAMRMGFVPFKVKFLWPARRSVGEALRTFRQRLAPSRSSRGILDLIGIFLIRPPPFLINSPGEPVFPNQGSLSLERKAKAN